MIIKSTLESWEICLGLRPVPDSIREQTTVKPVYKRGNKKIWRSTPQTHNRIKQKVAICLNNRMKPRQIYNLLLERNYLEDENGAVASFYTVRTVINQVRKEACYD